MGVREIYIVGKKTQKSINRINNHSNPICINGEIKKQSERKKIIREERENNKTYQN